MNFVSAGNFAVVPFGIVRPDGYVGFPGDKAEGTVSLHIGCAHINPHSVYLPPTPHHCQPYMMPSPWIRCLWVNLKVSATLQLRKVKQIKDFGLAQFLNVVSVNYEGAGIVHSFTHSSMVFFINSYPGLSVQALMPIS